MDAPEPIKKTFEHLKLEYPFYIVMERINGKFYVYKSNTFWDKENKKVRSKKKYLGRIGDSGEFIKKAVAETVISQQLIGAAQAFKFDKIDESVLTHLSTNCRLSSTDISANLKLNLQTVERRKKELENRYGIRYFASINYFKLGYSPYLVLVSFKGKKPPIDKLKEIFEKEPRVQLVMLTTGAYYLIMYMLVENASVLQDIMYRFNINELLREYDAEWNTTVFLESYGYVPMRDKFFELLEEKVWKRSKESPRPASDSLMRREYILLRELNADGSKSFAEIERKYGFGHGTARYIFDRLKEKGLIWRLTLTMERYNIKYNAIMITKDINAGMILKDRKKFLHYIIKDYDAPSNRFSLVGDMLSPAGSLFVMPVIKDGEIEKETEWLNTQIGGMEVIESSVVTQILLGELCHRKLDNRYSNQEKTLIEEYKIGLPKDVPNYFIE